MQYKKRFFIYLILFAGMIFLNSCSVKLSEETLQAMEMKGKSEEYNRKGLLLHEQGKAKEALACFLESLDYANKYDEYQEDDLHSGTQADELRDIVWNNLSLAYNSLGEYELSLEYIDKALSVLPNTNYEYVNKGNALSGLYRYEEALETYDMALEIKNNTKYAYYGKGFIYYDTKKYEEALIMFQKYIRYNKTDVDAILYIIYSQMYLDKNDEALVFVNEMIESNQNSYEIFEAKGELLSILKGYEETKTFYEEMAITFADNIDAQILLGEHYYNNSNYREALDYFMNLTKTHSGYGDLDSWIIYSYEALDEMDNALDYFQQVLKNGNETHELYNAIGNLYINKYMYMESIEYFDEAILLNKEEQDAYLNKFYSLLYGKRYTKCIEFGKLVEKEFDTLYQIPWYIGESYFNLSKYEEAILYYKKAYDLNKEDDFILSDIAYAYLMLEDYQKAEEYVKSCLEINSDNSTAQYVKEAMVERQTPINDQIKEFIAENYLYYDEIDGIEEKLDTLFSKDDMTNLDVAYAVEEMKKKEDRFTFVIFGEDYDYMNENEDNIEYSIFENIAYIKIPGFTVNTDNNVIEILDTIEDPKDKILVFDLRGNYGGLTDTANNILDALLPEYVTSTLISREGYTYNYYSDESNIQFKEIYVLINENTASAAELLTLGLKTYLNNVTVIGRDTFGKGVGQYVYEDKERKLLVYVVSHYWNVRQQNIMSTKIKPDIYVKSDRLEDYIKVIKEN